jgi:iron-sulfur cluster assembly accessory protein
MRAPESPFTGQWYGLTGTDLMEQEGRRAGYTLEAMITLTKPAANKVRDLLEQEGDVSLALRVAVRPGGCSGFSYEMYFDSEIDSADEVADYEGVRVVVDPQSLPLLSGAQLDYQDGLQGAGFAVQNPNITRTCGCGNSFS